MENLSENYKKAPGCNIVAQFSQSPEPILGSSPPTTGLPPIGVFWDIENCSVPKGKSASALVQLIRQKFFTNHREAEFLCVCDISKESKSVIHELNNSQVTVIHINATSKNAADEKLKQCMHRFADTFPPPATIILISGDVNFAPHLSDYRHRQNLHIILLHSRQAPEALIVCAHEHYDYNDLTKLLPAKSVSKAVKSQECILIAGNLPAGNPNHIQNRLRQLSDNCGGKVTMLENGFAKLKFSNPQAAQRAKKRMDKEDVYGSKISVNFPKDGTTYESSGRDRKSNYSTDSSRDSSPSNNETTSEYESSPNNSKKQNTNETYLAKKNSTASQPQRKNSPAPQKLFPNGGEATPGNVKPKEATVSAVSSSTTNLGAGAFQTTPAFSAFKKPKTPKNVGKVTPFVHTDARHNFSNSSRSYVSSRGMEARVRMTSPRNNQAASSSEQQSNQNSYQGVEARVKMISPRYNQSHFNNELSLPVRGLEARVKMMPRNEPSNPFLAQGVEARVKMMSPRNNKAAHTGSTPSSSWGVEARVRMLAPLENNAHWTNQSSDIQSNLSQEMLGPPIELMVTNLDQSFETNVMKKILLSIFREYVMVLHISMILQPDCTLKALLKIPSLQDAQYAISQLHRRKIGTKRILISHISDRSPPLHILRCEVVSLLSNIPPTGLPLFKFRELFEQRYHRSVSVSELYKMKESLMIQEEPTGRMVCLNPNYRSTPSPVELDTSGDGYQPLEKPYCELHYEVSERLGWAELESVYPLPDVFISLKVLAAQVHNLLDGHQGTLPLNSFCLCYKAEFGPLPLVGDGKEDDEHQDSKVSLEHLVACIPGIQIGKTNLGIKKIQWLENKEHENPTDLRSVSPALHSQLTLFTREVVDLIKSYPMSLIPFNKFIPDYHHHFGRQCRVADYGYTKLIDLMEALPHVVQILGQSHNRAITLTHRAQVKRFGNDLLRILKLQPSKQLNVSEFPSLYFECVGKPFHINDYGVCDISDLLLDVSNNLVAVTYTDNQTLVSIPKKEQTPEERSRTIEFSLEVIELLRHTPKCSMSFSKFIPSYHHHYNRQCRVADFGFSKLIELLEAMPDSLTVSGSGEEKTLSLVEKHVIKILSDRIVAVIKDTSSKTCLSLEQLIQSYSKMHGYDLRPKDFGFPTLNALLTKMKGIVKIVKVSRNSSKVVLVDQTKMHQLRAEVQTILFEEPEGRMELKALSEKYLDIFKQQLQAALYDLDAVTISQDNLVQLVPLHMQFHNMISLLKENDGHILLNRLHNEYDKKFKTKVLYIEYGFPNLQCMIEQLAGEFLVIKGKRGKRFLALNPKKYTSTIHTLPILDEDLLKSYSPIDLLAQPIPSNLPSPELEPEIQFYRDCDLMGFESPLPSDDVLPGLNDQEQCQINTPPLCHSQGYYPFHPNSEMDPMLQTMILSSPSQSFALPIASFPGMTPAFSGAPVAYFVSQPYNTISTHSLQPLNIPVQCEMNPRKSSSTTSSPLLKVANNVNSGFISCEDLTRQSQENCFQSTQSSPTRGPKSSKKRNRIAAHFSKPLDCLT